MRSFRYQQNRFLEASLPEGWAAAEGEPEAFHESLPGHAPTPLVAMPALARELGLAEVWVKDESKRFGLNAFKVLGASWAVHRLSQRLGAGGSDTFATATDGNHGRAVAWAAKRLGKKAVIFVPGNTVPARIAAIRGEGAEVVVVDGTYDETVRRAAKDAAEHGWQVISDTAYAGYTEIPRWIMEGYGTLFRETSRELAARGAAEPSVVFLQAGVGGLACAGTLFYRRRDGARGPVLVSVEPTDADCLLESIASPDGSIREAKGKQLSIMAGLNCGTPSLLAWPVIRAGMHGFIAVGDGWAEEAMRRLACGAGGDPRIVAGESGAAGLAGLLALCREPALAAARRELGLGADARVLLVNTEGDTDPASYARIVGTGASCTGAAPGERLAVQGPRLVRSLEELGRIGGYDDAQSGLRGVCRLALSPADGEGRRHVVARMKELGLAVTVDRIGNVFARRPGREQGLRPVMMGSHIDSVATAGIFDGCLGVLGALEVVRSLEEAGRQTLRPVVVAFFTEEEGARFGTDMLGSAVATGRIPLERAYGLRDRAGKTVRGELEAIGFLGDAGPLLEPPHAYLECHVEQGPVLAAAGRDIGVVGGVQAICWRELAIGGKSAHAGTTPMSLRADAGVAAARINLRLREMVASGRFGDALRATMGVCALEPGLVNVVAGRATATVDLRHPDEAMLERAEAELVAFYDEVSRAEKVAVEHRRTARTPFVGFDERVRARIAAAAEARGLSHQEIVSGAGHDAQEMARICPAGMIFVPGEHDGISHNPREHSTEAQCRRGVEVLLDVLLSLADEGGEP